MIRLLRAVVILVFIAGCGLGGYTKYAAMRTTENKAPVITMSEDTLTVSCDATMEDLLRGVTASDEEDGDLTRDIIVENASNFIQPGRCRIYYAVFDSQGKVASASRMLVYEDYTSPAIMLNEPLTFAQGSGIDILNRLSAEDCIDGDITSKVEILSSTVKSSVSGTYRVTVQAVNSHGDTSKIELPVIIYDDKDSNLNVTLDTPLLRIPAGTEFNAKSHVKSVKDISGNDISLYWSKSDSHNANVNVSGSVSTSAPGTYYVTYTVMSDNGSRGTAVLTVVVEGEEQSND